MGKLSKHFTEYEFTLSQTATRYGIDNSIPESLIENAKALCSKVLDVIREHYDRPVIISSGYRSPELNQAITKGGSSGSKKSQHMLCEAADFHVSGVPLKKVAYFIRDSGIDFDQLIFEGGWIHISFSRTHNRNKVLTAIFKKGEKVRYVNGLN